MTIPLENAKNQSSVPVDQCWDKARISYSCADYVEIKFVHRTANVRDLDE